VPDVRRVRDNPEKRFVVRVGEMAFPEGVEEFLRFIPVSPAMDELKRHGASIQKVAGESKSK
jgi:hypothetical protein